MSQRRRLFLTGSERAEFEHIHGPLTTDETDPRFVLVDEETEAQINALPPGVPTVSGQDPDQKARIRAAELEAWDLTDSEASDVAGGERAAKANKATLDENKPDTSDSSDRPDEGTTNKGK